MDIPVLDRVRRAWVGVGLMVALGAGCATVESRPSVTDPAGGGFGVSVGMFYDTLSPYGFWVDGTYGRVWRPNPELVGADFQPYGTGGRWVSTDYGWSFESDYDWGWATFHYGNWYFDQGYGWVWTPGTTWAPAWVDWRWGGGYVGWAPLPPPGGVVVVERYHPYWCFVQTEYMVQPNVFHYAVPVTRVSAVYATTTPIHQQVTYGGAHWYQGPPVAHVAAAAHVAIPRATVTPPAPGHVQMVRPAPAPGSTWQRSGPAGQVAPSRAPAPTGSPGLRGAPSGVRSVAPTPGRPTWNNGSREVQGGGRPPMAAPAPARPAPAPARTAPMGGGFRPAPAPAPAPHMGGGGHRK